MKGIICRQKGDWVETRLVDISSARDQLRLRSSCYGVEVYDFGASSPGEPFVTEVLPPGWDSSIIMGDAVFLKEGQEDLTPEELKRAFRLAVESSGGQSPDQKVEEGAEDEEEEEDATTMAEDVPVPDDGEDDADEDDEDDDDEVAIVDASDVHGDEEDEDDEGQDAEEEDGGVE